MSLTVTNPATGETIREVESMSEADVERALAEGVEALVGWQERSFADRAAVLRKAATILRERKDSAARLMAEEMGKPLAEGRSEAEKCAWVCEHYADHAEEMLADRPVDTDAAKSFVTFQPIGLVLAVMPWNFPFWQVFRFAAPSLMAGNGGLLKHASNVPGCALMIEEIFHDAGLPTGLFRSLLIGSDAVEDLIEDRRVRAVTLTGSTPAGRAVAATAGKNLKKTVLELGGSDAYVVLADADVDSAVETCVTSRLINSGQSCIAAKRFIVVDEVREEFEERFVARMAKVVMGDPLNEETDIGPQARHDLRDELHEQVEASIDAGATCRLGGKIPDGPGAFYPPTVLTGVRPGMPAYDDELFGPVAAILSAEDENDAIRIANDSVFGLGAAVFTADLERGETIAAELLEAGAVAVNDFVRSDPRMPFGGVKDSGYGRELSDFGIREFVNIKSVVIKSE